MFSENDKRFAINKRSMDWNPTDDRYTLHLLRFRISFCLFALGGWHETLPSMRRKKLCGRAGPSAARWPETAVEKTPVLTCWFWSELVPVGSAHRQEPVAQVQVVALLRCYAAHHLNIRERSARSGPCQVFLPHNGQRFIQGNGKISIFISWKTLGAHVWCYMNRMTGYLG